MSKLEMRMVEVCEGCGELVEHCLCNDEDTCDDCCECECCDCEENEMTDEDIEIAEFISRITDKVIATEGCPHCIFDLLVDLYFTGREHGEDNYKDFIKAILED